MSILHIKRIYEPKNEADGFRILVDRLWPRGLKRDEACVDEWLKGVAPSTDLRKWFNHDPEKWEEFRQDYTFELRHGMSSVHDLVDRIKKHKTVTLLYASSEGEFNHVIVLEKFINNLMKS